MLTAHLSPFSPWPSFTKEESDAVSKVLLSNKVNYWTGKECKEFEKEFSTWCDVKHAIALANGTVALDLALKALDIGAGDEVIVTSRTFIASVSSIVTAGATPIFADVDRSSQNITEQTIRSVITSRTKAIICVHLAGMPCDMDSIMILAKSHNLKVIEDCAQAHGAKYKGRSVGSIGHVAAWSFCQDKIITTGGEGGMVTTNDENLWRRMWAYKDHGKSYEAIFESEITAAPGFRWLHESFGTNWRMTEMQAAIGRIQLRKMFEWHSKRKQNANTILNACEQFPVALRVVRHPDDIEHAWYKCYVFIRPDGLIENWGRDKIIEEINNLGVPCFSGTCSEVYLEKAFDNTGWRPEVRLPIAKELGENSLMFLVHPTLTKVEINKTVKIIKQIMCIASK